MRIQILTEFYFFCSVFQKLVPATRFQMTNDNFAAMLIYGNMETIDSNLMIAEVNLVDPIRCNSE